MTYKVLKNLEIIFISLLLLTGFGGCQTPTIPQNVEQDLAYAYPAHAVATSAVTELLKQKKISIQAAENALEISKNVKQGLDLAQTLVIQGKPTDAVATLKLAMTALSGLQVFVKENK